MKIGFVKWFALAIGLAIAAPSLAQSTVNQGQGQSSGSKPWRVTGAGGSGAALLPVSGGELAAGAPLATVAVSGVSASTSTLVAHACYRIGCSAPVFFRLGTGATVALTTDHPLFGPAVETICAAAAVDTIAFVTSTGTATCTVGRVN